MSEPVITEITSGLGFPEGPVWMPDGTVLVVEMQHGRITRVHPDGRKETVAEPARGEGRVQRVGAIYYAQPDGSSIREVVFPSESPNGIGLSPDGARLYAAETHTGRLYAWNVTGPGEVERNAVGAMGAMIRG